MPATNGVTGVGRRPRRDRPTFCDYGLIGNPCVLIFLPHSPVTPFSLCSRLCCSCVKPVSNENDLAVYFLAKDLMVGCDISTKYRLPVTHKNIFRPKSSWWPGGLQSCKYVFAVPLFYHKGHKNFSQKSQRN